MVMTVMRYIGQSISDIEEILLFFCHNRNGGLSEKKEEKKIVE